MLCVIIVDSLVDCLPATHPPNLELCLFSVISHKFCKISIDKRRCDWVKQRQACIPVHRIRKLAMTALCLIVQWGRQPVRYRPCKLECKWIQSNKVLSCLSFLSSTLLTKCNNTFPANRYRLWLHLECFQEHFVERIQYTADTIPDSSEKQTGQL